MYKGDISQVLSDACPPFLKWPGGKRWLRPHIEPLLPSGYRRYFEPFLGGGAIFFGLLPPSAHLSDSNAELINAYQQVRDCVNDVLKGLDRLNVTQDTYDRVRNSRPRSPLMRAIRFIYLSKTAFNGIYRVNRQGRFNVPFGHRYGTDVTNSATLTHCSGILQTACLETADFAAALSLVKRGDLVYCDPPYTVRHDNNGFIRYNQTLFSWDDQERLAALADRLRLDGAHVFVSNAHHRDIRKLYPSFRATLVERHSSVGAQATARGPAVEYLFSGHPS